MNSRILVLAIALSVTALLVTGYGQAAGYAASGPAEAPLVATVTAYGLNVRTGPGVAYSIIGGLGRGDTVEVLGKNAAGPSINSGQSTWLQIAYSGREAWIAAAYVDLSGSLEAVPVVSAPPPPSAAMESRPTVLTPETAAMESRPTVLTPETAAMESRPTSELTTSELTGKLVFQVCNGCDIYVINADGSGLRRLTDGMDPAWSPDGQKVAFARWRDPRGIYVIDEDGSNETLLFGWSKAKAPAWSPDGSHIVFTRQYGGREEDVEVSSWGFHWTLPANPWWKLGLVRLEDRYFTELLCYDHSFSPTWSPNGKVIAYDSDYGLHLTATDGSIGGQSYDRSRDALSTDPRDISPAWSPDGTKVAFGFSQHDHWEIYVMNADGSNRVRLTHEELFAPRPPNNVSPAWSPDGRHIAFFTDRSGKWELYVMNADGSNQRPMFPTGEGLRPSPLDGLPIEYGFVAERMVSWTK